MPRKETILVVEDDNITLEFVKSCLAKDGYNIVSTDAGEEVFRLIKLNRPDLVILDILLPDSNGIEICKAIKQNESTKNIPVILLTIKSDETDIVQGLEKGADDYILKPFNPRILLARVNAVLRRSKDNHAELPLLRIHDLIIDPAKREVSVNGDPLKLTYTEFVILMLLARRPGWVYTRGQIVDAVWGKDYPITDRSVDVQIVGLRKKLTSASHYIETVRRVGYRFKELSEN